MGETCGQADATQSAGNAKGVMQKMGSGQSITKRRKSNGAISKQRIMPISYLRTIMGGAERDEARFCEAIRGRLGAGTNVCPVGRARIGIYLLIKFAIQEGRRKVLMSPFTIHDVVKMVTLAGGEPVFFDFEADSTFCDLKHFESLLDEETACALVTHYHLNEPSIATIAGLCHARGAFLFDDCAIAFGGSIGQQPVGSLTDASVFSFSSFKLLNFFWGGVVTSRDERIVRFLQNEVAEWPRLAALDYFAPAKACLKYDLASRPPFFSRFVFPLLQKRVRVTGAPLSLENVRVENSTLNLSLTSRPSFEAFAEWNRKLPQIDGWLALRRKIARVYQLRLGERMVSAKGAEAAWEGSCFVNYPVVVPEARCDDICREMMLGGFDVGRNLYPNVHRHPSFSNIEGVSRNVDRLTRSSIYLPTHFGVSVDYAEAIAERLAALAG